MFDLGHHNSYLAYRLIKRLSLVEGAYQVTDESTIHDAEFLVKWERHSVGHSPYLVVVADGRLAFAPHSRSVLNNKFEIPFESISEIESSDNFLGRGAVNIMLQTDLVLELDFSIPKLLQLFSRLFEPQQVFSSKRIRLFLGSDRQRFLGAVPFNSLQAQP